MSPLSLSSSLPPLWPGVVCMLVALASTRWWIPALRRWGIVDVPTARSSHRLPTIRGAGLGPASGVLAGLLTAVVVLPPEDDRLVTVLLGTALATSAVGLAEDIRGLRVSTRVATQSGLGLLLGALLVVLLDRPLWWALLMALAGAVYVNAANFMDGVDGMSALHGLVSGVYFVVLGLGLEQSWLVAAGAVTAGAFTGFAPWNLLRGRVFLGDVGSYLLGALVVGCGASALLSGVPLLLAVAPALPYLGDTGLTVLRRAWRRERILEAHRTHVYQRLTDRGCGHLASAGIVAGTSVICCLAAWWGTGGGWSMVGALLTVTVALTTYLTAPRWLGRPMTVAV